MVRHYENDYGAAVAALERPYPNAFRHCGLGSYAQSESFWLSKPRSSRRPTLLHYTRSISKSLGGRDGIGGPTAPPTGSLGRSAAIATLAALPGLEREAFTALARVAFRQCRGWASAELVRPPTPADLVQVATSDVQPCRPKPRRSWRWISIEHAYSSRTSAAILEAYIAAFLANVQLDTARRSPWHEAVVATGTCKDAGTRREHRWRPEALRDRDRRRTMHPSFSIFVWRKTDLSAMIRLIGARVPSGEDKINDMINELPRDRDRRRLLSLRLSGQR